MCCPANTKTKHVYINKYIPRITKLNELEVFRDPQGDLFGYRPLETKVIIPIQPHPEKDVAKGYNMYSNLFYKVHDSHANVYYYGFHITENTRNMLYAYIIDQFNLKALAGGNPESFKNLDNYLEYFNNKGLKCDILVKHNIMMLPEEEHKIPVGSGNTITLIPFINHRVDPDNWNTYEINFRVAK